MFEEANLLLDVVHKCASAGSKLNAIGAAAMTELLAMNEHCRQVALTKKPAESEAAVEDTKEAEETTPVVKPTIYPSGSQTATLADTNARRV